MGIKDIFEYYPTGDIKIAEKDNPDTIIDHILASSEFDDLQRGVGQSFSAKFLSELMYSGFYITSATLYRDFPWLNNINKRLGFCPLLNIWKMQTVLFFDKMHISKSIKRKIKDYQLKVNYNFVNVINSIINYHGRLWISPLKQTLIQLNKKNYKAKAISFEVYKNGELKAGEIGIQTGKIYTSYSGFIKETSAGSVQIAMMLNYLKENDFLFCNFGTDDSPKNNAYKRKFGAEYIDRAVFIDLWRKGREL